MSKKQKNNKSIINLVLETQVLAVLNKCVEKKLSKNKLEILFKNKNLN